VTLWGLRTVDGRRRALADALGGMAEESGEPALAEIAREDFSGP
jgi:hypothetical protein